MQGNKLKKNKTKQKNKKCNIRKQEMCVVYNKHRYITSPILVTYLQWSSADQPVAHPIPSISYKSPSNCILLSGIWNHRWKPESPEDCSDRNSEVKYHQNGHPLPTLRIAMTLSVQPVCVIYMIRTVVVMLIINIYIMILTITAIVQILMMMLIILLIDELPMTMTMTAMTVGF